MDDSFEGLTISYTDDFDVWPQLSRDFEKRLPLNNVKWTFAAVDSRGPCTHVIPALPIRMLQSSSRTPYIQWLPSLPRLDTSLLHIYFLPGQSVEQYKNERRQRLREWIAEKESRDANYMIIHIDASNNDQTDVKFHLRGSVFDRLRSEVSYDRCAQLPLYHQESSDRALELAMWNTCFQAIKSFLLSAVDKYVMSSMDFIRKLESSCQLPGWNLYTYVLARESLAYVYSHLTLYSESLLQYQAIQSVYDLLSFSTMPLYMDAHYYIPQEFGLFHQSLIVVDWPLNVIREEYLRKPPLSLFTFQGYLFARQYYLLYRMQQSKTLLVLLLNYVEHLQHCIHKYTDDYALLRQAKIFSFANATVFEHVFIYSLVSTIMKRIHHFSLNETDTESQYEIYSLQADLYLICLKSLEKLGIANHFIEPEYPWGTELLRCPTRQEWHFEGDITDTTVCPPLQRSMIVEDLEETSNNFLPSDIQSILVNISDFIDLYNNVAQSCMACLSLSKRKRMETIVLDHLATLLLQMQKYEEAVDLLKNVIREYEQDQWALSGNYACIKLAFVYDRLNLPVQHMEMCLTIIGKLWPDKENQMAEYYQRRFLAHSKEIKENQIVESCVFQPSCPPEENDMIQRYTDDDRCFQLHVKSLFPQTLENIMFVLHFQGAIQPAFSLSHQQDLVPGMNKIDCGLLYGGYIILLAVTHTLDISIEGYNTTSLSLLPLFSRLHIVPGSFHVSVLTKDTFIFNDHPDIISQNVNSQAYMKLKTRSVKDIQIMGLEREQSIVNDDLINSPFPFPERQTSCRIHYQLNDANYQAQLPLYWHDVALGRLETKITCIDDILLLKVVVRANQTFFICNKLILRVRLRDGEVEELHAIQPPSDESLSSVWVGDDECCCYFYDLMDHSLIQRKGKKMQDAVFSFECTIFPICHEMWYRMRDNMLHEMMTPEALEHSRMSFFEIFHKKNVLEQWEQSCDLFFRQCTERTGAEISTAARQEFFSLNEYLEIDHGVIEEKSVHFKGNFKVEDANWPVARVYWKTPPTIAVVDHVMQCGFIYEAFHKEKNEKDDNIMVMIVEPTTKVWQVVNPLEMSVRMAKTSLVTLIPLETGRLKLPELAVKIDGNVVFCMSKQQYIEVVKL